MYATKFLLTSLGCVSACVVILFGNTHAGVGPASGSADLTVYGAAGGDKLSTALVSDDLASDGNPDIVFYSQGASPLGRPGVGLVTTMNAPQILPPTIDLATVVSGTRFIIPPAGNYGPITRVAVGDFNDDGHGDVVVSAPCIGGSCDGTVFIVLGGVGLPSTVDLQSTAWPVIRIDGVQNSEGRLGYALVVGDINNDGVDDLVMSAPFYYYGYPQIGAIVYVIWGSDALPPVIDLNSASSAMRLIDSETGWGTGMSLACGDVNLDGADDILIGAQGDFPGKFHGKAVLVYGGIDLPAAMEISAPADGIVTIWSDESQSAGLGNAVALADVNRDLYKDIIVAAAGANFGSLAECGVVYVVPGSSQVPPEIDVTAPPANVRTIVGADHGDFFGSSLTAADFSGDGYADIVAASDAIFDPDTSLVSVVFGSSSMDDTVFVAIASAIETYSGSAVAQFGDYLQVGDFDRDGVTDLVVAEHRSNGIHCCVSGELHIILGTVLTRIAPSAGPARLFSYPNPFTAETVIEFYSPGTEHGALEIFDVAGRRVRHYPVARSADGMFATSWDGRSTDGRLVPSGVYFARVTTSRGVLSKKLLLVR